MKKSEVKDYVLKALKAQLKPEGYYLVNTGWDPHFVLKGSDVVRTFFFNFKSHGGVAFSMMQLSIREVEEVMREVGQPRFDPVAFEDGKKYFLTTVEDKLTVAPVDFGSGFVCNVATSEDLELITSWLQAYLQHEGEEFAKTYSYLPNILANIDRQQSSGLRWIDNGGILEGGLNAYFRGLIISRLCNDPNYPEKVSLLDEEFADPLCHEWLPYYLKLKERLKSLEPRYSYTPSR